MGLGALLGAATALIGARTGVIELHAPRAVESALARFDRGLDVHLELINDLPHAIAVQVLERRALRTPRWVEYAMMQRGGAVHVPSALLSTHPLRAAGLAIALADAAAADDSVDSVNSAAVSTLSSLTAARVGRLECHVELDRGPRQATADVRHMLTSGGTVRLSDLCRTIWRVFARAQLSVELYHDDRTPDTAGGLIIERLYKSTLSGVGSRWVFAAELNAGQHTRVRGGYGIGIATLDGAMRCRTFVDSSGTAALLTRGGVARVSELCAGRWRRLVHPAAPRVVAVEQSDGESMAATLGRRKNEAAHRGEAHEAATARGEEPSSASGSAVSDAASRGAEGTKANAMEVEEDGSEGQPVEEEDIGEFFFHAEIDELDDETGNEGGTWRRRRRRRRRAGSDSAARDGDRAVILGARRGAYGGGGSGARPGLPV